MSWNSTTLKASRPCVRLSSARSVSCCTMSTVELMATTPPITMLCGPVESEQARYERDHRRRAEHLQRPQAEHFAAQRHHARPGKFQAQREQQEDHAEFGQQVRGVRFGEQAEGMRPQHQPDGDVAQYRRQPQAPRQRDDENRGGQQYEDEGQWRIGHSREKLASAMNTAPDLQTLRSIRAIRGRPAARLHRRVAGARQLAARGTLACALAPGTGPAERRTLDQRRA